MTTSNQAVKSLQAGYLRDDWRLGAESAAAVHRMEVVGRYRCAIRAIDPPLMDLSPVEGAVRYEIALAPRSDPASVHVVESDRAQVDLSRVWANLPFGEISFQVRARDADGALLGMSKLVRIVRSPDWQDPGDPPMDYRTAAKGVIDYLLNRSGFSPSHPTVPAIVWHAGPDSIGPEYHPFQFPALVFTHLINLFLTAAEQGIDEEIGVDLVDHARQLADFLLQHPAVEVGPLAGIPFSTMDQEGNAGLLEPDRTLLIRLGWTAGAMLRLGERTGDTRYIDYAQRLAAILLEFQREDGSWPFRVQYNDGAIFEPYTAGSFIALLLFEQLEVRDPDGPYTDAINRGIDWLIANPIQTGNWQPLYEDIAAVPEPFTNLEQTAAMETARFLLRRGHPKAVEIAQSLVRFVEDQFVIFGSDPINPIPYSPYTPGVMEQYRCYWPMDTHTAKYARVCWRLFESSGDPIWARKAVASANTVVHCQGPDGRFATIVPDRGLGVAPDGVVRDWFNCMAYAADVLLQIGEELQSFGAQQG